MPITRIAIFLRWASKILGGIINWILTAVVIPTHARPVEIVESQTILALRPLLSYTSGDMLYFANGSNIILDHLNNFLYTHGVTLDTELRGQQAFLHNFRLRADYSAHTHGTGAKNIESAKDKFVEGVVMAVTPTI